MKRIPLDAIVFDAGTQVRVGIDQQVVSDYADAMTEGAKFPAVVVFHDGTTNYLADGFHRFMAAQRNAFKEIEADVRPGTKDDALWFALGANKTNGQRLNDRDVRHAIEMSIKTWPERSGNELAKQIGCSQGYVSKIRQQLIPTNNLPDRIVGKDGKSRPATYAKRTPVVHPKRDNVAALVSAGRTSKEICLELDVRPDLVAEVRRDLGVSKTDRTREGVRKRRETMREMALDGYSSRQIASAVSLTEEACRKVLKDAGIAVLADAATRGTHRHNSNRIIEQIVMDAENLTEGVNLIEYDAIDRNRLADWVDSLIASKRALDAFIKRLIREKSKHGEAA